MNNEKVEKPSRSVYKVYPRKHPGVFGSARVLPITTQTDPLPRVRMSYSFNTGLFSMSLFLGMVFVLIPVNMSVELVQDREVSRMVELA